jgi:hypothetical protein
MGAAVGNPNWCHPESCEPRRESIDHRCDVCVFAGNVPDVPRQSSLMRRRYFSPVLDGPRKRKSKFMTSLGKVACMASPFGRGVRSPPMVLQQCRQLLQKDLISAVIVCHENLDWIVSRVALKPRCPPMPVCATMQIRSCMSLASDGIHTALLGPLYRPSDPREIFSSFSVSEADTVAFVSLLVTASQNRNPKLVTAVRP